MLLNSTLILLDTSIYIPIYYLKSMFKKYYSKLIISLKNIIFPFILIVYKELINYYSIFYWYFFNKALFPYIRHCLCNRKHEFQIFCLRLCPDLSVESGIGENIWFTPWLKIAYHVALSLQQCRYIIAW